VGVFGSEALPESAPPAGVEIGSLDHLLFITLTVVIDYQRDAPALWSSSRRTFEDPETHYLFEPQKLVSVPWDQVCGHMKKHRLAKKPVQDTRIWRTVAITFAKKWNADPRRFLDSCGWDGPRILERLREDTHINNGRLVADFPFLRGDKIGPLWVRMLRDNVGLTIRNLEAVPIPVDVLSS
jgi:hypothetical protein